jgi:hypothetical protein
MAPSRTQSQSRPESDVLAAGAELVGWAAGAAALCVGDGAAADDAGALGLGDAVALGVGSGLGETVTVGLGEMLTLGMGRLPTAFLTVLPHPAAIHAAARIAAERTRLLLKRGITRPFACLVSDRGWPPIAVNDPAVGTIRASPAMEELRGLPRPYR